MPASPATLQCKVVCGMVALQCKATWRLEPCQSRQQFRRSARSRESVHRTRSALEWGWVAFFVFGVATLVSAVFTLIDDGNGLGVVSGWSQARWLVSSCSPRFGRMETESGVFDRAERLYAMVIGGDGRARGRRGLQRYGGWHRTWAPLFPIGAGLLVIGANRPQPAMIAGDGCAHPRPRRGAWRSSAPRTPIRGPRLAKAQSWWLRAFVPAARRRAMRGAGGDASGAPPR